MISLSPSPLPLPLPPLHSGNRVTGWVTTEILKHPSVKSRYLFYRNILSVADTDSCRTEILCHFIDILSNLYALKNFNSLIHVLSSLHSSTISKLKRSWNVRDILGQLIRNVNATALSPPIDLLDSPKGEKGFV